MHWQDTNARYGLISRGFHWAMAALIFWQLGGVTLSLFVEGRPAWLGAWIGTHKSVGTLLLGVALIRALWGLGQLRRRPPALSRAATLGHIGLYALMIAIPLAGLAMTYLSGRPLAVFGYSLWGPHDASTLMGAGAFHTAHHWLGWALLAAVAGHITMALYHHRIKNDGVLSRMLGHSRTG
ncbi:cytochrome b [Larsenimonas salina]|uniref:cytochrome b n=1 Tax=Larsenimonas salina TaxID=1295565 RepID=UPI00207307E0|nr:cytochrome b [Larsenimonas salina]MCM5704409.1 cytochrome b [Larsenimonas salina]